MVSVETFDLNALKPILLKHIEADRSALIPILLEAQQAYGYLSEPLVVAIGETLNVPMAEIHGVIELYTMLFREPNGKNIIRICTSPVCTQLGSETILKVLCEHFGIQPNEMTSDGQYIIEEVPCLCLCDHAPMALIGNTPVAHLDLLKPLDVLRSSKEAPLGRIGASPHATHPLKLL